MATTDKPEAPKKPAAERAVVSLHGTPNRIKGLIEEFGEEEGRAKYAAIANLEGEMIHPATREKYTGRYFFDPAQEGPTYTPDLVIATLPVEVRKRVAEIINTPQVKEA